MVGGFVEKLRHFAEAAERPAWWDGASVIEVELDAELQRLRTFEVRSSRVLGDAGEFELEWRGRGRSITDVRRDVYGLCGRVSEEAVFIDCAVGEHEVQFDVVIGWHTHGAHGHALRLWVVGERIQRVIDGCGGAKAHLR